METRLQIEGRFENLLRPELGLAVLFIGIAMIMALIAFKRLECSIRLLVIHIVLSLYVELIGTLTNGTQNHLLFTVYIPFDFGLMLFAARDYIKSIFRPLALVCCLVFLSLYVYALYRDGLKLMPFMAMLTYWIMLLAVWLMVLVFNMRRPQTNETRGIYFISGFVMLFYGCTIPIWAMFRFNMINHPRLGNLLQNTSSAVSMARYLFTGVGLLIIARGSAKKGRAVDAGS